ncbi:MAG: DUF1992 domain-containing protein [Antricoccus sp.]
MTQRKPPGVQFETWVDKQIREATKQGKFDNLPGAGRPLEGISGPDDELWWVHQLMRREGLVHLPPSLQLRKDAESAIARARAATTVDQCRCIIEAINIQIRDAIRTPMSGPPHQLTPFNVAAEIAAWREGHPDQTAPTDAAQISGARGATSQTTRKRLFGWIRTQR